MHILIFMAVATVLIILWAQGNLFACVFLSIVPALGFLIFAIQDRTDSPGSPAWMLICAVSLAVIWVPLYLRRRRAVPQLTYETYNHVPSWALPDTRPRDPQRGAIRLR